MVSKRQYLPITFWNPLMRQSRDIGKLCYWYNFSAWNCQAGTKNILAVSLKTARAPQLPINIAVLFHATLAFNITVDPYNLWDKILAALYHSTLLVLGILWPFIVLKHQSFNVKQNSIRYSLFYGRLRVEGRGANQLFFVQRNYLLTYVWAKQLLWLKVRLFVWSLERWVEFFRLSWTAVVKNCG